jgi:2-aminobenzoate-CoA ligase
MSAHVDSFARDHLPAPQLQPAYLFDLPELQFPETLNCASELLDRHITEGRGARMCLRTLTAAWTYVQLYEKANQIAQVLVDEMGLVPGNRVLLRAPNNPMLVACWFAVVKAGGIAVATMPLLRAKELKAVIEIGQISHALCDATLADELNLTEKPVLRSRKFFNAIGADSLEVAMASKPTHFVNIATSRDDTCMFAFTSGTTGVPKATMHFHRDVMAACACWPRSVLRANAEDVFIGSPPLAFTFGLGGLVLFPLAIGASTVLLEKASPPQLLEAIESCDATVLFTAPTSYRVLAAHGDALRASKLRKCVSAGEALPAATRALWREATGIELIDGIGATELLHIFISADEASARPGATGKAVAGYQAQVVDDAGNELQPGTVGQLRVRGPTGCRYLNDARQTQYVRNGWNYTGDAYLMDVEGYFFYQARTDDMIVSAGYNIAAPEVEEALMTHAAVAECGVIGVPDEERGQIVKAFVVLRPLFAGNEVMGRLLQDHVKQSIAPYKYPRAIKFVDALPRTATGKLQRFRLKES